MDPGVYNGYIQGETGEQGDLGTRVRTSCFEMYYPPFLTFSASGLLLPIAPRVERTALLQVQFEHPRVVQTQRLRVISREASMHDQPRVVITVARPGSRAAQPPAHGGGLLAPLAHPARTGGHGGVGEGVEEEDLVLREGGGGGRGASKKKLERYS